MHAYLLGAAAPVDGEHVVHVGTGMGYYTAIMAEMVGKTGLVTGIEFDPQLAAQAKVNLARYPNVYVVEGNGTTAFFDTANLIYVNAGATAPAPSLVKSFGGWWSSDSAAHYRCWFWEN